MAASEDTREAIEEDTTNILLPSPPHLLMLLSKLFLSPMAYQEEFGTLPLCNRSAKILSDTFIFVEPCVALIDTLIIIQWANWAMMQGHIGYRIYMLKRRSCWEEQLRSEASDVMHIHRPLLWSLALTASGTRWWSDTLVALPLMNKQ